MGEEEEEEREEEEEGEQEDVFYKMLGFWGLAYCKWFNVAKGMGGRRCIFFFPFLKVETFKEKEEEDVAWLVWLDHHVRVKKKKKKLYFIRC